MNEHEDWVVKYSIASNRVSVVKESSNALELVLKGTFESFVDKLKVATDIKIGLNEMERRRKVIDETAREIENLLISIPVSELEKILDNDEEIEDDETFWRKDSNESGDRGC